VPMQSPRTLKDKINRGDVSHHQIEVDVEALFDDLRRDQHAARTKTRIKILRATKLSESAALTILALFKREACVKQIEFVLREEQLQRAKDLLSAADRVANDRRTTA